MSDTAVGFFLGFIIATAAFVTLSMTFYEHTALYKRGQIDALSGKALFELKKQKDGTVVWERKESSK